MKITELELKYRIKRTLDTFFSYRYTVNEKLRKETDFYFITRDFNAYHILGGDLKQLKKDYLFNLLEKKDYSTEQKDFIIDLIEVIDGHLHFHFVKTYK